MCDRDERRVLIEFRAQSLLDRGVGCIICNTENAYSRNAHRLENKDVPMAAVASSRMSSLLRLTIARAKATIWR